MPLDLKVPRRYLVPPDLPRLARASFTAEMVLPIDCTADGHPDIIPICLDTDRLLVGDIFLFHRRPTPGSAAIHLYQRQLVGMPRAQARITHVAIYGGGGHLWDHNPGTNIRKRTVNSALKPGAAISVSRSKARIDRDRLTRQCEFLQSQVNYQLFRRNAWRGLWARARSARGLGDDADRVGTGLVCSSFAASVLSYASRGQSDFPVPVVLPGDFANPAFVERCDIEWSRTA